MEHYSLVVYFELCISFDNVEHIDWTLKISFLCTWAGVFKDKTLMFMF